MKPFEKIHEFEEKFSDLTFGLIENLQKAEQLSECIESKYNLNEKSDITYITVNRNQLLVDMRIIHDYVEESYKLASELEDMA